MAGAASRNRVVVFQGVGLDSLHPYAYSGGGISGIWQHVIDHDRDGFLREKNMSVCWPSRGSFKEKMDIPAERKVRFHDGSPFTSKDVLFPSTGWSTTARACKRLIRRSDRR